MKYTIDVGVKNCPATVRKKLPWLTYTEDGLIPAVTGMGGVTATDTVFEGLFPDAESVTPMANVDPDAGDEAAVENETVSWVAETYTVLSMLTPDPMEETWVVGVKFVPVRVSVTVP